MHKLKIYGWSDGKSFAMNVKRGVLNNVTKMQNPLLCKDLQAIGALKKHLEKNHILQSVVSFSILWQKWHLTCWILGFCVNKLSFFIIWQNCPLPEVIFVTPVTADGSVKFLPELCKFLQKQHIQHDQHKKLSLIICLCFFLSKLLNKFMSNQIMFKLLIFINHICILCIFS